MRLLKIFLLSLALCLLLSAVAFAAPILKMGAQGHDVRILQQELGNAGYNVSVTGVFDEATHEAVLAFQRDASLEVTGTVDRATWHALRDKKSPTASGDSAAKKDDGKNKRETAKESKNDKKNDKPDEAMNKKGEGQTAKPSGRIPESEPFVAKGKVHNILGTAKKYVGVKYVFGGTTPKGFDCSGFVQYVFRQHGFALPRAADEQCKFGRKAVDRKGLVPGDLVFFSTYEKGASHVGIYLGDNRFIHVSSSKGVRVDSMDDSYWKPRYYVGKHIVKD